MGPILIGIGLLLSITNALPTDEDTVGRKSYAGYRLLRTQTINEPELAKTLMTSLDGKSGVHFWTFPRADQPTDILTSPNLYPHVKSLLDELKIEHDILHDDISKLIEEENLETGPIGRDELLNQVETRQFTGHRMNWRNYQRYDVIREYCQTIGQRRGKNGAIVSTQSIGKSFEGRDIILVKVSSSNYSATKPGIWLDGGMHAREWISPATVTYILEKLITDTKVAPELINEFDWYILPIVNVDGYEYTHTRDRLWRKTRSRTKSWVCRGVDPNRNWAYNWGRGGSSGDPCSDIYRGPYAFSEVETRATSNAILARRNQLKMYISFHSYSQLILLPWGFSRQKPSDYNELYSLGLKGKQALERTYGTRFRIGSAPDILYAASGGSDDWAKGKYELLIKKLDTDVNERLNEYQGGAGIKYSYTYELRDTGRYGFNLPASQIIPSGEETFNSIRALALGLRDNLKGRKTFQRPFRPGK